jgi:hypothetical protein
MDKNFCCKIDSDIDYLENLSQSYKWIPGKNNIRPSSKILDKKDKYLKDLKMFYESEEDYILSDFFNFKSSLNKEGKIYVQNENIEKKHLFINNMFPYDVDNDTNHYVLWYSYIDSEMNEEKINKDINSELISLLLNESYDFVWYKNPKSSFENIFHVQVFWIKLK